MLLELSPAEWAAGNRDRGEGQAERICRRYATPWEVLKGLPEERMYLKAGQSVATLSRDCGSRERYRMRTPDAGGQTQTIIEAEAELLSLHRFGWISTPAWTSLYKSACQLRIDEAIKEVERGDRRIGETKTTGSRGLRWDQPGIARGT